MHVGANDGQERGIYHDYGLNVVWVEAIPDVYEMLVKNVRPYPNQIAINALLTDVIGEKVRFYIANNNGQSSSIFDLALHRDVWPEVDYVGYIELETNTLDNLLSSRQADQSAIDALVLDTQGSELLVLKGSEQLLHHISYVKVEAADFEAYKGGATVESIQQYLKAFSFVLVEKNQFAIHPESGRYYDLLFKRSF